MIRTLRVRNLAVIAELELELGSGLNVLTGETGAGKSVLLSAISMLCGRRVSSDVIRSGESEARVEAIFDSAHLAERARELGLAGPDDDELLVVRTISREARGRVFVNGQLATVSLLGELLADEVEIVSQGEHQRLLRPEVQSELLDDFADLGRRVAAVEQAHRHWRVLTGELHERRTNAEERARREDQLRFELEQIESVSPRAGEIEELEAEHQRLAHVDRLGQGSSAVLEFLEGESGIREPLARARAELDAVRNLDPALAEPLEGLERAAVELSETARALEQYRASLEADPARLDQVEQRLAELGRLQSRYGATVEEILVHRERAREELDRIGGGEAREARLEAQLVTARDDLERAARELEKSRRQAGLELAARVQKELRVLELGGAVFGVAFEPLPRKTSEGWEAPSGPRGLERAAFELAANLGEEPRRLRDAASGGELARLLLALRNVLRDSAPGGLLLFDEIDAGISGRTGHRVGERLRALARTHQTLCITHLSSIAALGETHYRVDKRVRAGRTRTVVVALEGEQRVDEIARMGGAGRVTEAARTHARELLS